MNILYIMNARQRNERQRNLVETYLVFAFLRFFGVILICRLTKNMPDSVVFTCATAVVIATMTTRTFVVAKMKVIPIFHLTSNVNADSF